MAGGTTSGPGRPAASNGDGGRGAWRPILEGEAAERARAVVAEIADAVDAAEPEALPVGAGPEHRAIQSADLGSGLAGISLLHAELAAAAGDDREAERARALQESGAQALGELTMGPAFLGGFAGIAWAVETVERRLTGDSDLAGEVDDALAEHAAISPWPGEYDLVSGLAGFAAFGLDRLPAPSAVRLLEVVLERLDELGEETEGGIAWRTPAERLPAHQRERFPGGCWNAGLAHGSPGVIAVLAGMLEAGIGGDRARRLLEGAARWLLAQRLEGCPAFPALVDAAAEPAPSRLAWCYGDPGVALALYRAGAATADGELLSAALEIARIAAEQPFELSGVRDAGLCHGAAGLAHIFNRFHQASGEEVFADAARRWLAKTLDYRRPGEPVGGFAAWQNLPEPHWEPSPGLLNGAAGVGLALAAALYDVEPLWDHCVLMNIRAAR